MVNESSGVFLGPGSAVGPYRIASVPSAGFYEAVDPATQRRVAIRLLAAEPQRLARLRSAINLRHPNLVPLLAIDQHDGKTYLISEFPSGTSLADRLSTRGRIPWREATRIIAD